MKIQVDPPLNWEGNDIDDYDGNCLMKASLMEDFIRLSTAHSALCCRQLVLKERKFIGGTGIRWVWKCPVCEEEITHNNCEMIRSKEVAQGAAYSRMQPDFNLRMVKGASLTGINTTKLQEFVEGEMGIRIASDANLRKQLTKVRAGVNTTYEERKIENRKEHVATSRASENYRGDIEWKDQTNGELHSTCCGDLSIDGAGCTRSYNHRHKGRQSAFVVNSKVTGKPLTLVVSQVRFFDLLFMFIIILSVFVHKSVPLLY